METIYTLEDEYRQEHPVLMNEDKEGLFNLKNVNMEETNKSLEIKILCEVEKIWIVHDAD